MTLDIFQNVSNCVLNSGMLFDDVNLIKWIIDLRRCLALGCDLFAQEVAGVHKNRHVSIGHTKQLIALNNLHAQILGWLARKVAGKIVKLADVRHQ